MAQVRRPTRTWSPMLEVDGMPIAYDATLRHYRGGHASLVAEALEQPLLLPQDMEAYRTFNHPKLFLSLKRDLAMVSDYVHFSSFIVISLHFIAKVIVWANFALCSNCMGGGQAQYYPHSYKWSKKGPGPISSVRANEYPRIAGK